MHRLDQVQSVHIMKFRAVAFGRRDGGDTGGLFFFFMLLQNAFQVISRYRREGRVSYSFCKKKEGKNVCMQLLEHSHFKSFLDFSVIFSLSGMGPSVHGGFVGCRSCRCSLSVL